MLRTRFLAVALVVAAACSDDPTGPGTGSSVNLDVAMIAADATAEDIDVMAGMDGQIGSFSISASLLSPPDRPSVNGCPFGLGRFNCPAGSRDGLDVERTVTFRDAAGAAQAAYDALTTASIDVVASIDGDVTRGPWSAEIHRTRTFTVSGLAGTETTRTVNGTGTDDVSRSRHAEGGPTRSYDLVGTSAAVNVVIPVRGEGVAPWPLSGTITRNFTITPTGDNAGPPVTKTIVITFNGTANVIGTINGEEFTINLAARRAVRRG